MFPKHYMAIRLVVLTQTSSCFIERVFSKLKLIRDAVGDNTLENITEVRLLVQCKGNYKSKLSSKLESSTAERVPKSAEKCPENRAIRH
eukprot:scaffold2475_cov73-Skeletonema_menzelii.AAC.4